MCADTRCVRSHQSLAQRSDRRDGTHRTLTVDKTYEDKASAKNLDRPKLRECLDFLREGDTLHVHSLDRLARNMEELLRLVRELTGRGVTIHSHKENLIFGGNAADPFQTLMLQMLGSIAQFERSLINERRREGMAEAKARGKAIGAPVKLSADQVSAIRAKVQAGGVDKKALAKELGISRTTLYKAL